MVYTLLCVSIWFDQVTDIMLYQESTPRPHLAKDLSIMSLAPIWIGVLSDVLRRCLEASLMYLTKI